MKLIDQQTQQDLENLGARLTSMANRYEALHLPGEAGTVTFVTEDEASDAMKAAIVKRTVEVAKLAHQIGKVTTDANLSAEGQRAMRRTLDADRRKLADRLEGDAAQVGDVATLATLGEAQLYEAPAIERGDVAAALVDGEIRAYFAARSPEQLGSAIGSMSPRQIEAMVRSPVPMAEPLARMIDAKWEAHLMATKAREFESVQADLSNGRFGVNSLAQLQQAVARLEFHDAVIRPHLEEAA
jgi:hypothetical protein